MEAVSCTTASKDEMSTIRIKPGTSGSKHIFLLMELRGPAPQKGAVARSSASLCTKEGYNTAFKG